MSTLFVDTINEKTSGNGIYIPGHVVQVKHAIYGTQTDISSGGYIDSGVTATITPHSTSFKILVIAAMQFRLAGSCLLYTSPSPRDRTRSRMPSSA